MSKSETRQWGTRLADVRVPRYWWVAVIIGLLLGKRLQDHDVREAASVAQELGEVTTQRWQESDSRDDRLIALTETLSRLTWAVLAAAAVTLVVNVVILFAS